MTLNGATCMDKSHKKLKTRAEARNEIRKRGLTIKHWSEKNGLNSKVVFEVLGGRKKGLWGEAHKAAVLLGIKDGVIE